MQTIILASTSPRRKALLKQIGLDFKIIPSNYEEDMTLKMSPAKLVKFLARSKSLEVANRTKKGIVIGVDTFVVYKNKKFGKPKNKKDAKEMLRKISNKKVKIYSGISIINAKTKKELLDYEVTKVKIKRLSETEINKYINSKEPMDKAGAFAIQGLGAIFITSIKGCYSNAIGLPLHKLKILLEQMGINIFEYDAWQKRGK